MIAVPGKLIRLVALGSLMWISAASAAAPQAGDISGYWWATKYSPKLEIEGGGELPYNEQGKALYAKNIAGLKDGSLKDEARRICVRDGIPRLLGNPYPFQILHKPEQTYMFYELNRVIRVAAMNKAQMPADELELFPFYIGHSVAHWEGDTLVVETAGFIDSTFLDATGAPHSDKLTTVERIRKIGGGRQLENVVTITDPVYLTRPVTARFVYESRPDTRLQEYVCGEEHRDISAIPGVTEARRARGQ